MIIIYACPFLGFLLIGLFIFLLIEEGFFTVLGSIILTLFCFLCLIIALISFSIFLLKKIDYEENYGLSLFIFLVSLSIGLYIGFEKDVFYNVSYTVKKKIEYDKKIRDYNESVHYYAFYNFNKHEDIIEIQYKINNQDIWEKREVSIDKKRGGVLDLYKITLPRNINNIRIKTTNGHQNYYVYLSGNINTYFTVKAKGEEHPRIIIGYFDKTFCQIDNNYSLEKKSLLDRNGMGGLYDYNINAYKPFNIDDSKKEKL